MEIEAHFSGMISSHQTIDTTYDFYLGGRKVLEELFQLERVLGQLSQQLVRIIFQLLLQCVQLARQLGRLACRGLVALLQLKGKRSLI